MTHRGIYLKFSPAENLCYLYCLTSCNLGILPREGPFAVGEAICQGMSTVGFSSPVQASPAPLPVHLPLLYHLYR